MRRLFSSDIVESDAFIDMPISCHALYFHLGMNADDDGFVNPRKIMRMIGASDDDLKVLLGKRFLLSFQNGVVVIKHWLIHNTIRKDRYKPTRYTEEIKSLFIKENKAYTDVWQPTGNQLATQVKLSKVKLSQEGGVEVPLKEITKQSMQYHYDDDVREIRKKKTKISKEKNNFLISIGMLWVKLATEHFGIKKEEVPIKNIYYPIRALWEREKWDYDDFKNLFKYFFSSSLKEDDKISFDLCMSEKYVAKYKISVKTKPVTNVSASNEVPL